MVTDLVAIHTLACAARERYEKHCQAKGVDRMFDYVVSAHPDRNRKEFWDILNGPRNFLCCRTYNPVSPRGEE